MRNKYLQSIIPYLLKPLVWAKRGHGYRILILHDICSMNKFEKMIDFISKRSSFISPGDIENQMTEKIDTPKNSIIISFDDGFLSSAQAARDILNPRGIKALFFVPVNFIGMENDGCKKFVADNIADGGIDIKQVPKSMLPMKWEDLRRLKQDGHTIGAHTLNHSRLSLIKDEKTRQMEIVKSGDMLEEKLGTRIEWFAFPFGDVGSIDPLSYKIIRSRYRFCCSGIRGKNTSNTIPYCLTREHIDINAPLNYIEFIINGGLDFYYDEARKIARSKLENGGSIKQRTL